MGEYNKISPRRESDRRYYLKNRERIKRQTRAYALSEKGIEVQRLSQAKYRKTDASRHAKRTYKKSDKGRETELRSERSEKGKARHRRYLQSEKGRRVNRQCARRSYLKITYGLTYDEYNKLVARQKGMCRICQCKVSKLVVDHTVKGTFRGLLCNTCNVGIGMLRDSVIVLQSAIRYLKEAS